MIHFIRNYTRTLSAFPCGRTQHVRRSSIISMIQSVLEFRFMRAIPKLYFRVISVLPFSTKNAFVTAYLLESSQPRFKNVVCSFQTISCLLSFKRETNGSPQPLVYFLPYETDREQEVHKCIHSKHFRVSGIKLVMSWQKKLPKYCSRHCITYGSGILI